MSYPPPELQRFPRLRDLLRWLNQLRAFTISSRPLPGPRCNVYTGANGSLIDPVASAVSASAVSDADHPFKVVSRAKPNDPSVMEYGVILESSLYKSLRPNDKQSITGLLNAGRTAGWFDLSIGGYIWLGIVFNSSGEVTSAVIDNSEEDDFDITQFAWARENAYIEDDEDPADPRHQTSRKLIAYTVAGDDGSPVVRQVMFRDQVLRDIAVVGRPARYPFDHEGGYPL